jgi:hypothetical protein
MKNKLKMIIMVGCIWIALIPMLYFYFTIPEISQPIKHVVAVYYENGTLKNPPTNVLPGTNGNTQP